MTSRTRKVWAVVATFVALTSLQTTVEAQFNRGGAVGGVAVDASGVLKLMSVRDRAQLAEQFRRAVHGAPAELAQNVPIRRISLNRLEAACRDFVSTHPGEPLPDELRYLGGLLHIQFVVADPENGDIILAGPAEGWRVDEQGNVVGITSGQPVMHLEDLLVALRNVDRGIEERITCSIDPTPEGQQRLARLMATQMQSRSRMSPRELESAVKRAFGPQIVRITGVPASSRFAHVLLASDYKMKRLAMALDSVPGVTLKSYVELLAKNPSAAKNSQPRWWMAPNFKSVSRSEDGLTFEIAGPSVKVLTEDEYIAEDGTAKQTGRKSKAAAAFAKAATSQYDELAKADLVFAELRNLMELSVVAAIIERFELTEKTGASLPMLTGADTRLRTPTWNVPKRVDPSCTITRVRQGLLVTASGGVEIDAWQVAGQVQVNRRLADRRQAMLVRGASWWAN